MSKIRRLRGRAAARLDRTVRSLPVVRERLDARYEALLARLEAEVKPYRGRVPSYRHLPAEGRPPEEILAEMEGLAAAEDDRWREGLVSGAVYHGEPEHVAFLNRAYSIASQANPLHADLWPSAMKYEAEIVSMTAHMLGVPEDADAFGAVTSGGTESILLAMKAYRDQALAEGRTKRPAIVAPTTAHAAFDKAAEYFGMRINRVPVDPSSLAADVEATERAVDRDTVVLVGSAPTYPHGVIDPIAQLALLARRRDIALHVDACLGGFVLPWAERLGYPVPPFDFRVAGVTSMSADTHKFGYAAKGTSVVLYRTPELRRRQYFAATDWPGGLYVSPTLAGSRPGGLSAACWAAMVATGERGYLDATRRILEAATAMRRGIEGTPGIRLLGDPLFVLAFASDELDVYRVMDRMAARGWELNGLQRPPAAHVCVTLRHARPGVPERFVRDLRSSVDEVRAHPRAKGGMAPVYGMASRVPLRGVVGDLLRKYLDLRYRV